VGGLAKGHAVPFVSAYGRSGSGKSTLVRFVCESLKEGGYVSRCAFVNLRKARTVFGCASAILSELAGVNDGWYDMDRVMAAISTIIMRLLEEGLFVLVLDEFDSLFYDRRGRPSDFVYRLLEI
jgi:cell division control protein 6